MDFIVELSVNNSSFNLTRDGVSDTKQPKLSRKIFKKSGSMNIQYNLNKAQFIYRNMLSKVILNCVLRYVQFYYKS